MKKIWMLSAMVWILAGCANTLDAAKKDAANNWKVSEVWMDEGWKKAKQGWKNTKGLTEDGLKKLKDTINAQ